MCMIAYWRYNQRIILFYWQNILSTPRFLHSQFDSHLIIDSKLYVMSSGKQRKDAADLFRDFQPPRLLSRALGTLHWQHKALTCDTAAVVSLCKRTCGDWSECRLWWRGHFHFIRLWGIRHCTLYQREIYFLSSYNSLSNPLSLSFYLE